MNDGFKNLIPAQKGEVRNPNGRPKGARSSKSILQELLNKEITVKGKDGEKKKIIPENQIWETAVAQAITGDKDARRDIYDRLEGKPLQRNENVEIPATPEQKLQQLQEEVQRILSEDENENVESESLITISPEENTEDASDN